MPSTEIDVRGEFARLHEAFDAFASIRQEGEAACRARAPEVSGWSVEQHLYHIALATDLAFRHVKSLVARKGGLIQQEGEIHPRAAQVLEDDVTPRGEAQAPRMVTPDETVEPRFLEMEMNGNREALAGIEAIAD